MIKKKHILILVFFFLFFNIILISIKAQQEATPRNVEIDGDSDPEFVIHWRYSDFPDNTRADEVVGFVENAAKNT